MPEYRVPETQEQALTLALDLGLIAADDEKARAADILADKLAAELEENTVEPCRAAALERWEAEEPP